MQQAQPIMEKLKMTCGSKKLAETAFTLANSPDPSQRNHAYSFWESLKDELISNKKIREQALKMESHNNFFLMINVC